MPVKGINLQTVADALNSEGGEITPARLTAAFAQADLAIVPVVGENPAAGQQRQEPVAIPEADQVAIPSSRPHDDGGAVQRYEGPG